MAELVDATGLSPVPIRGESSSLSRVTKWVYNSAGSECLPYKQDVVGPNPTKPTNNADVGELVYPSDLGSEA